MEETSVGLVGSVEVNGVSRGVILDPEDLTVELETGLLEGFMDGRILYQEVPGAAFTLLDVNSGEETVIAELSRLGQPSYGHLSPDGRHLALAFESPSQVLDVWVIDTETLQWIHVPSMPVMASIKVTDEIWAPDGRLVILGEFDEAGAQIGVWSPGDSELSVRTGDFPSSSSFAVLCVDVCLEGSGE